MLRSCKPSRAFCARVKSGRVWERIQFFAGPWQDSQLTASVCGLNSVLVMGCHNSAATPCIGAWHPVQARSMRASEMLSCCAMRFERAVVKVAAARAWASWRDQTKLWFWCAPAPPWQPEELQEAFPVKADSAACVVESKSVGRNKRLLEARLTANIRRPAFAHLFAT